MIGIPNLSDGTPLSYEWLNQVADAINKLTIQNADDSNVKFVGRVNGQDIQVLTGEKEVNLKYVGGTGTNVTVESEYQIDNIEFKFPFAEQPWVIASVYIIENDAKMPAAITLGNVTQVNFDASVQLTNPKTKLTKFYIRYVAIGKKQAKTS